MAKRPRTDVNVDRSEETRAKKAVDEYDSLVTALGGRRPPKGSRGPLLGRSIGAKRAQQTELGVALSKPAKPSFA